MIQQQCFVGKVILYEVFMSFYATAQIICIFTCLYRPHVSASCQMNSELSEKSWWWMSAYSK